MAKHTDQGSSSYDSDRSVFHKSINTASGVFRGLEKKGYIVRSVSEDDQRAKHIVITEKGLRLVEKAISEIVLVDVRFFHDERDTEELIRLLKKYF
jgi:DNA-binding MarR family transcriptional regulator